MDEGEALALVRRVLGAEFELEAGDIAADAHLVDDLDLDSVDAVALSVRLEEEADFALTEEDLKGLRTVADVVRVVCARAAR